MLIKKTLVLTIYLQEPILIHKKEKLKYLIQKMIFNTKFIEVEKKVPEF